MMKLIGLVSLSILLSITIAKRAVIEDDYDAEDDSPKVGIKGGIQMDPTAPIIRAAKVETHKLLHRFDNDDSWTQRGTIEVAKDSQGKVLSVSVENDAVFPSLKQEFDSKCKSNNFYQIRVDGFDDLLTSIPACHYAKNGFNDTLVFHADSAGKINALSYDVVDYQYLASLEKHPKKKRLLTTKQYDVMETKGVVQQLFEGTRPIFMKYKYDSLGRQVAEKAA